MAIKPPTPDQICDIADDLGISLSDDDVKEFGEMIADTLTTFYAPLDAIPDYLPEPRYPRTPGHRPGADEDPLHAWHVKTSVKGAESGKLTSRRGIDDTTLIQAGCVQIFDTVVRAVDQVIDLERGLFSVLPFELLSDLVDRPVDLPNDILRAIPIVLEQALCRLLQGPVLLLDEEHVAVAVDDHKIDLAEGRVPGVLPGPVD